MITGTASRGPLHEDGLPVDMSCYLLEGREHLQATLEMLDRTSEFLEDPGIRKVQRTTKESVYVSREVFTGETPRSKSADLTMSASWVDSDLTIVVRDIRGTILLQTKSPLPNEIKALEALRSDPNRDGREVMMSEFDVVKRTLRTLRASCTRWKDGFAGVDDDSKTFARAAHCSMMGDIDGSQLILTMPDPFNPLLLDAMMTLHQDDPKGARRLLANHAERMTPAAPTVCKFSVRLQRGMPRIDMSNFALISDRPEDPMGILSDIAWLEARIRAANGDAA